MTPKTKHKSDPPKTTISLELAKIRIDRWLQAMLKIPGFKKNPESIPRAIYISFDDIKALQKECKKHYKKDELVGIRVYFGLGGEAIPMPATPDEVRGLVVPVLKVHKSAPHTDAVHIDASNPNDTNIYDFTTPCPKYCDTSSELYLPVS
ncbi:hypothetical protein [Mucilaginibacter flavus]|uniref:hypothetical protein n=1 Tax=Mucilaginibacter flavus TaxID=931504 RepID=UPI0025B4F5A0|nr:hypothetical protein [Mucilaginibacter flavus]MDN3583945.1 hypothetical protein [Mucilaginibacter flavus]